MAPALSSLKRKQFSARNSFNGYKKIKVNGSRSIKRNIYTKLSKEIKNISKVSSPKLSKRALENKNDEFLLSKGITMAQNNRYDPVKNPKGIINLGTAENRLNNKELLEKLNDPTILGVKPEHFLYGVNHGSDKLRDEIASLMNRYFHPKRPISKENLFVGNGCGPLIDQYGKVLCDPGDAVLVPSPYYGGFDADLKYGAKVYCVPVPHTTEDCLEVTEEALEKALSTSKRPVKAILISNPNNPYGRSYTSKQLMLFCKFAKSHGLFVISDEIYALSSWKGRIEGEEENKELSSVCHCHCKNCSLYNKEGKKELTKDSVRRFNSIFSIDLPDPENTCALWGFSKDFCINGLRIGVAISYSSEILDAMKKMSLFTCISTLVDGMLSKTLSDHEWVDKFIFENNKKLYKSYTHLTNSLKYHGIKFIEGDSGFFIYLNLREFKFDEHDLWMKLLDAGVYIAPSEAFFSKPNSIERGWFRICFAVEEPEMDEALKRLYSVLKKEN